jgi:acyl phosphate:glycerol-3-phosphate acyltransferase
MTDVIKFAVFLVAAYLIGSIPMAYIVTKRRYGANIRQYGSGQVGASNVYRSFSKRTGIAIGLYDIFKGILLVWIASLVGLDINMQVAIGIAVIAGHNWPVFLHFNAGRGLATSVGVGLYLLPLGLPPFIFCAIFTLFVGSSPLPLLASMVTLPLTSWALDKPLAVTLGLTAIVIILIVRRLTAPKTARSALVSTRQLYLNRLFFDRDIRDGKAWITSRPANNNKIEMKEKK